VSTLLYRKPRLLVLILLTIAAAGLSAFATLPRMEDPELTDRFGIVLVRYPGADAERVEALVAEPLEDELLEVEEIGHLDVSARDGILIAKVELGRASATSSTTSSGGSRTARTRRPSTCRT
jgi:multidrug efflux pump subunit AcrB